MQKKKPAISDETQADAYATMTKESIPKGIMFPICILGLAAFCAVLFCDVLWCAVLFCGVVWCGVVWFDVEWCGSFWNGVPFWNGGHLQKPFA